MIMPRSIAGTKPSRWLGSLLILGVLLFAWAELDHAVSLDAHEAGESCALCLMSGSIAHVLDLTVPTPPHHSAGYTLQFPVAPVFESTSLLASHRPRGPPGVS